MVIMFCVCALVLSGFGLQQESEAESYEEDDTGAEHDGQIGMQMNAWQIPHLSQGYPRNHNDTANTSQKSCDAVYLSRNTPQEE
jgi:hypothetical protein